VTRSRSRGFSLSGAVGPAPRSGRNGSGPRRPLSDAAGRVPVEPVSGGAVFWRERESVGSGQEVMQCGSRSVAEPGAFAVSPNVVEAPTASEPFQLAFFTVTSGPDCV